MLFDPGDGLPQVGSHRSCLLGVRPAGKYADIDLVPAGDLNGDVAVNRKGLSVSADLSQLPGHLIPQELDDGKNAASGKGMKVYIYGTGVFIEGAVSESLEMLYKPHSVHNGVVCPTAIVSLNRYQVDLEATRACWVEDSG